MKIAIIGHKRIPSNEGGIEKGVEQHAVRMVQRGNDVTVYNRGGHNVFGKEFDGKKLREYKGVKIVTVPTVKGAACVPIYSFLATIHAAFSRYDCVSFRASGSCAMIPLAKLLGLRVVASLHGIDSQRDKWGGFASKYLEFGERMAATKADVCLVLSKNMKQYIDTKYGVNSVLFANGIRFLYKGIIINHNKKPSQPTLKRRFFKKKAAFFHGPVWERSGADFILKRKGEFF